MVLARLARQGWQGKVGKAGKAWLARLARGEQQHEVLESISEAFLFIEFDWFISENDTPCLREFVKVCLPGDTTWRELARYEGSSGDPRLDLRAIRHRDSLPLLGVLINF